MPIEEVTTSAGPHDLTRLVIPLLLVFQSNASFPAASRISITNGAQPLWQHIAFVPMPADGAKGTSTILESHRPVPWQRTDKGLLLLLPGITQPGVTRSFTSVTEKGEPMGATDLAVRQTTDSLFVGNSYFRVEHPRTGNGGFPTTIRFNQSGVEDTQFVFEDRLFEPKAGYRTWRADDKSAARIVESGPLEVIVEAKALATGAPGNPRATYRYRYRAYSPIIEVTAHVERDDDYPWRELHFLQISRKDNCYPKWAGGEPTQTGSFTDASRGYSLDRWAMMANEDDALGLSIDGIVTLYDGVSEYYNYVQQSIGPFTARSADFRALVYIGPARNQERVRELLAREPTITVKGSNTETESTPERNAPRSAPITAGNDAVSIGFASARDGLGVVSLFSRRTGHEYMTKTPGKPLLWRLVLHGIDGTPLLLDNTQPAICEVAESSRKGRKVIDLTWKGITVGEETEALSVTAHVELPSGSDTTLWSLDVDNHSKKYGLWEVHFPLFVGLSERGMPD
ncbi:MAG: hypothetical protein HY318_00145, partial [Armatimonadetes bacterium]|nr:hypothetical protein [Armatimonadota bacterium]